MSETRLQAIYNTWYIIKKLLTTFNTVEFPESRATVHVTSSRPRHNGTWCLKCTCTWWNTRPLWCQWEHVLSPVNDRTLWSSIVLDKNLFFWLNGWVRMVQTPYDEISFNFLFCYDEISFNFLFCKDWQPIQVRRPCMFPIAVVSLY